MPIKLKTILIILSALLRLIDAENINAEVQTTGYWGGNSSVALTIFYYVFRPLSPVMSGVRW
jgi:hypothetical protein